MATESPLFHDGSHTTADADLSAKQFFCVFIDAANKVQLQGTTGSRVYGILQNTPTSGQAADVGFLGVTKAVAGAAITAGDQLMVDSSGRVITKTITSPLFAVGWAIEAATGANNIITIFANPSTVAALN